MADTCRWLGYDFDIYYPQTNWLTDKGGVYIFAKQLGEPNSWGPLYVGKATIFADRLGNHERWPEAVTPHGATHIHTLVVDSALERGLIEQALITEYNPPMNTLLTP